MPIQALSVPSHPIGALSYEYSGRINTLSIGGSLRALKDEPLPRVYPYKNDPCIVNPTSSSTLSTAVRDPVTIGITGIPVGATIVAAHLYWAGSYSPDTIPPTYGAASAFPLFYSVAPTYIAAALPASNSLLPDYAVTLNGTPLISDKNMTDTLFHSSPTFYNPAFYPTGIYPYDFLVDMLMSQP
ncbi:MAG: hypothetical protein Q9N67_05640 [Ghiorsea sp.]|nr:hypothetical protein [Ghiorsea sp.]MDQ7058246.1 hypothetical protein [Ghiorsea sp.]